jgi:hypothetical protein
MQKDAIERGGSIEVFADADLAKARAEYIQGVLKNSGSGLGAEYYAVLLLDLQRLAGTHPDDVALQFGENHRQVRHRLAHRLRVSMPISVTISRQPCSSDRRTRPAKSSVQRLARSTLVKISASDSLASSSKRCLEPLTQL